jgi:hypothetical protein
MAGHLHSALSLRHGRGMIKRSLGQTAARFGPAKGALLGVREIEESVHHVA